ncbi:hypothetical protein J3E68DRAFT_330705 [Trichoderma sp. SZMC 28012]
MCIVVLYCCLRRCVLLQSRCILSRCPGAVLLEFSLMFQPDKQGEVWLGLSLLWCVSAEAEEEEGKWALVLLWHSIVQLAPGALFPSSLIWSGFPPPKNSSMTLGLLLVCMLCMPCFATDLICRFFLFLFFFFFHYFLFSSLPVSEGAATPRILKEAKTRKRKRKKRKRGSQPSCAVHPSIHPVPQYQLNTS